MKPWSEAHQKALTMTLDSYVTTGQQPTNCCYLCYTTTTCYQCSWVVMIGHTCNYSILDPDKVKSGYPGKAIEEVFGNLPTIPQYGITAKDKRIKELTEWIKFYDESE